MIAMCCSDESTEQVLVLNQGNFQGKRCVGCHWQAEDGKGGWQKNLGGGLCSLATWMQALQLKNPQFLRGILRLPSNVVVDNLGKDRQHMSAFVLGVKQQGLVDKKLHGKLDELLKDPSKWSENPATEPQHWGELFAKAGLDLVWIMRDRATQEQESDCYSRMSGVRQGAVSTEALSAGVELENVHVEQEAAMTASEAAKQAELEEAIVASVATEAAKQAELEEAKQAELEEVISLHIAIKPWSKHITSAYPNLTRWVTWQLLFTSQPFHLWQYSQLPQEHLPLQPA